MKNEDKKVNVKEETKAEEQGVELTDEQMAKVTGGKENTNGTTVTENISATITAFTATIDIGGK